MAHSGLRGKSFKVTDERILNSIDQALKTLSYKEDDKGVNRAKRILDTKDVSYETMESMSNFYRHYNKDVDYKEYLLLGGDLMKNWVFDTLKSAKDKIESGKEAKSTIMSNQYRDEHSKDGVRATETRNLREEVQPKKEAALCVLFNNDKKVLLVQRSANDQWMPGKWAFPGGGVEIGEDPEVAVKRECGEEIGVIPHVVDKFDKTSNNGNTLCHMFLGLCKDANIKLNPEHQDYKWCDVNEIITMDCVPGVYEDVLKAMK